MGSKKRGEFRVEYWPGKLGESSSQGTHQTAHPPNLRKQMGTSPIPRCKAREAGASAQTHPRDCRHGAGTRGGMDSTVRDKTPRISGGRVGTTRGKRRPAGGGRAGEESTVREASGNGRRGNWGRFRRASRAPGRLPACNRRLDASGRLEVPGRDRDPQTKILSPRPRPARPPPRPNVHRPLPRPTERHGFQQSNPRLPRCRRPPGPFPPSALVEERKEKGGGGARRPLTMIRGGAATPAGEDALSRVASVPLPRAPAAPALLTHAHTHARRAHARPPPRPLGLAPLPRGAPSSRAVSGARRSPPPPLAGGSPAAARGGQRGRGGARRSGWPPAA